MLEVVAFYIFSVISIFSFLGSVYSDNVIKSLLFLLIGLISISVFYFMLNAEFLGVIQIIVYAGSILSLYGFLLMFVDIKVKLDIKKYKTQYFIFMFIFCVSVLMMFIPDFLFKDIDKKAHNFGVSNIDIIGIHLFSNYLLLFEITAVMLLAVLICALLLTSKKMEISFTFKDNKDIDKFNKLSVKEQEDFVDTIKKKGEKA